jgi:hypothetical protein
MEADNDVTEALITSRSLDDPKDKNAPTYSLFAGFSMSINYILPISMMM